MLKCSAWFVLLIAFGVLPADAARTRTNVDRGWKFLLGDEPKARDPGFDDGHWQYVNLPHSLASLTSGRPISMWGMDGIAGMCGWMRRR